MYAKKVPRLVIISFWILILLLALARTARAATVISISPEVEVDSSSITLKDIAHIETTNPSFAQSLGQLRIGKAPRLGGTKRLPKSFIITRLKQLRLNLDSLDLRLPDYVNIKRLSSEIKIEEIARVAKDAILKAMDFKGQDVHIRVNSLTGELVVPQGEVSYQTALPSDKKLMGRQVIPIQVFVDGLFFKKVNVSLTIEIYAPVWVAVNNLKRHQVIEPGDIRQKRMKLNDLLGEKLVTETSQLVGFRTRVPIRAGKAISAFKIEKLPTIERGDRITIKAFQDNISLLTSGQALESGKVGELIRVKCLNNQKMLMTRVVSKDLVELEVSK